MTFEERARTAVHDVHRAVEVTKMSTYTDHKQPGTVERFDRFRDRKNRNRRIGAILVAAALAVAAIVVVSANVLDKDQKAVPAAGLPTGTILYEVYAGGDTVALFTIDAAGGPSEDLGVDTDGGAQWSADGTRILVTSTAGPSETMEPVRPATVAADGSDFRLLDGVEDHGLNVNCSTFSPDGNLLACHGYSDIVSGIYTVRASDGGGLRQIADVPGIPSDFSPDGTEVVFAADETVGGASTSDASTLSVVGVDGTGLREITPPGSTYAYVHASWSPDGRWIAYVDTEGRLSLVHPDGSGRHAISVDSGSIGEVVDGAAWSPDGEWIAFPAREVGADNPDIYLVRPDGSDVRQLTNTPDIAEFTPDWKM